MLRIPTWFCFPLERLDFKFKLGWTLGRGTRHDQFVLQDCSSMLQEQYGQHGWSL